MPDTLQLIALATRYPVSFFLQQREIMPENVIYRKRATVAQKLLMPIAAQVNIIRLQAAQLVRDLNIPAPKLPALNVTDTVTPMLLATRLRRLWKIDASY